MKLTPQKYALVRLQKIESPADRVAVETLALGGTVEFGQPGDENEFFVIKLKDKYAPRALDAYAQAAMVDGQTEYAQEVMALARRAAFHPKSKRPD